VNVALAAGGTGGHLIPAIVVAESILEREPKCRIVFIGSGKQLEKDLLSPYTFQYKALNSLPFVGKGLIGKLKSLLFLFPEIIKARSLLKEQKTKVLIGFGGYPAVVPVIAAWTLGIPRFIFEQNGKAGRANRLLAKISTKIFAVPGVEGLGTDQITYVSNPVRKEIRELKREDKHTGPLRILVIGGSQGAVRVNSAIISLLPFLKENELSIHHQTGDFDFDRVSNAYNAASFEAKVTPFIKNMAEVYSETDLVIGRAGATTVAEIVSMKMPAIFIPLAIAEGHQEYNIKELLVHKAVYSLRQDNELESKLQTLLKELIENPSIFTTISQNFDSYFAHFEIEDGEKRLSEAALEYCHA